MTVDRATYRSVAGAFPTGVCVVTAVDEQGIPRGLTTQSFVGVSTEPPLILVSIDKSSRTLAPVRSAASFVVNILREDAQVIAETFASKAEDKFARLEWVPSDLAAGAPMLPGYASAIAECGVVQAMEAGDHWLFLGEVLRAQVIDDRPLMYFRRLYAGWPVA